MQSLQQQFTGADWMQVVLVATFALSIIKPLLEQWVPGFKPGAPSHDPLLVALNFFLCLACVLAPIVSHGAFAWSDLWSYILYTIEGFSGSQTGYHAITKLGLSVNARGYSTDSQPKTV